MPDGSDREFENRQLFEQFLQEKLHIPRLEWNSLAELGRGKKPFLFETCHFCGGYPDVVRNCVPDPTTPSAQAEMKKHIKQYMQEIALYLPPICDDVADDAPKEDSISDNAVGTQSSSLDKLSAVTWCTQSQQELRDSQVQMEPTNTVDEQLQSNSRIEARHDDSVKKNHGIKRSKENKDGDKPAQKLLAWSEWSKWAFDKEQRLAHWVGQDQEDYDCNYEPTRQNIPETPRYPEEDDKLADRPMDTFATSSHEAISNLDNSDENHLRSTHKDKSAESLALGKGKSKTALESTPSAHPSQRATLRDNDSQMLSRRSVPKTASLDQNKLSSSSATESSFLHDDSHQQANAGDDTVRDFADSMDEPEEDLDPRKRL
ncbi:hypothetical protein MAC_02161 [Metarhizium acridum CQMa 102]|uniref:Uncharacterized protein n=1 Tax=Metarhizium acridum (strain CQMa 102) TaxID=655827 RepID=E9DX13_METAQ|nr:uncharacterized protein MAC_02161 [Metarhizium acridum CQMa 102]EFY91876.1 hypothetical protein MAC_02161 [Metarhizium acridum CQMa 102]